MRPVGANREVPVDVRIVCATNVDLQEAVEQGRFREDLFYRLDVVHLEVPPLRSRGTDVLLLAAAFLERLGQRDGRTPPKLPPHITARLLAYDWPGNVRELLNLLERVMALSVDDTVREEDLPTRMRQEGAVGVTTPDPTEPATVLPMAEVEKRYIQKVLALLNGNKSKAAEALGLDRSTLYRKLQSYGAQGADEPTSDG